MPKFRKKPVVIEAIRNDGNLSPSLEPLTSFLRPTDAGNIYVASKNVVIETLEGKMIADPGDWIIRGVAGEVYPCKPDIFAATYDPVPE